MVRCLMMLILVMCFSVFAKAQIDIDAQNIDYVAYQKKLSLVLAELSELTHINFAYSNDDIPYKYVTINAVKLSLREILDYVLTDSDLVYEQVDFNVVIYKREIYSREKFTIRGTVYDAVSSEKLIYADVYLDDYSVGATTNDYGNYSITIKRGELKLLCSYLGYEKFQKSIELNADIRLDIALRKNTNYILEEVLITADKLEHFNISFFKPEQIDIEGLKNMVSLGGEDDILRLMYSKAGVLTGADGFGGMHVRGGDAEHNQIILDGVPIYNAEHAIGLFSIINSSVIKNTKFLKDGFPARYGGNLSSVLDIRTRDGDKSAHHGEFNIGLFTLKAALEGPIKRNKASYLFSLRRTYADIWINSLRSYLNSKEGSEGETLYYNYDFNGKLNYKINDRNELFLSYYSGGDSYKYDYRFNGYINQNSTTEREEVKNNIAIWGNSLLALRWNHNISPRLFLNASLLSSSFRMNSFVLDWVGEKRDGEINNYRFSERLFLSNIKDYGIQFDFEYTPATGRSIRFGLKTVNHQFAPAASVFDNETYGEFPASADDLPSYEMLGESTIPIDLTAWESRLYVENKILFGRHTNLNIGLHLAHFFVEDKTRVILEPRISLKTKLSNDVVFSASTTMMSQFLHLIYSNGLGFPSQVWLPSTKRLDPQKAWQLSMGLDYKMNKSIHFFLKAFYKSMDNLTMAGAGDYLKIENDMNWDSNIPVGLGFSYGLESGMIVNTGKTKAEINYSLMWSKRKFEEINSGELFDYRFSRRHNVNVSFNQKLIDNVDFTFSWTYGSGNPFTFPTQIATFIDDGKLTTKFIYEKMNNHRIRAYHRMDVEFNIYNSFPWGRQKFSLGAYNVYNRKNPFYITYDNKSNNLNGVENTNFNYVYVFPLIPVINYSISF